jgi:DNA-binding transcriptional ArsR family regulator
MIIQTLTPTALRSLKTEMFEQFARVAKALSSGVRLEVLDLLAQREYSVETLAEMVGQSLQNMSRHLQILRQAKLVTTRKEGNFVHYRLTDSDVSDLVAKLQHVSHQHLSEIDEVLERFACHAAEFEQVEVAELLQRAQAGELVVLDVRPTGEFAQGHLPHAQNIPLSQLQARLEELPRDKPVVAYCRGKYCLLAYAAVDLLNSKGVPAKRAAEGIIDWKLQEMDLPKT